MLLCPIGLRGSGSEKIPAADNFRGNNRQMCGISAILRKDGTTAEVGDITRMCAAIAHRGPDGAGYALLNRERLALGHVRLSVIDLHAGDQPIYNEDGSICIVYNGEVYDHEELRIGLLQRGHKFRTHTDTEVLLHLYEE